MRRVRHVWLEGSASGSVDGAQTELRGITASDSTGALSFTAAETKDQSQKHPSGTKQWLKFHSDTEGFEPEPKLTWFRELDSYH